MLFEEACTQFYAWFTMWVVGVKMLDGVKEQFEVLAGGLQNRSHAAILCSSRLFHQLRVV